MTKETVFPHGVLSMSETEWSHFRTRFQNSAARMSDSIAFSLSEGKGADGQPAFSHWLVGAQARRQRGLVLTGADKYTPSHYRPYVLAGLIRLAPEGTFGAPGNKGGVWDVFLSLAHPPDALPYIDRMLAAVQGTHRVELADGSRATIHIHGAMTFDEPSGGAVCGLVNESAYGDGKTPNPRNFKPGQTIGVFDLGGKISTLSMVALHEGLAPVPDYRNGVTFPFGVQDIQAQLNELLRDRHPGDFTRDLPTDLLDDIIRNRGYGMVYGLQADYSHEYNIAIGPVIDNAKAVLANVWGGAPDARLILLTGGGSGVLHNGVGSPVDTEIFPRHEVVLVQTAHAIHMANVRGGKYITSQALTLGAGKSTRQRITAKLKGRQLWVAVVDAGNSMFKGLTYTLEAEK